jgi:hypothetical protein
MPINNGQHIGPALGKTGVIPFLGPAIEKKMMKASAQARAFRNRQPGLKLLTPRAEP